MVQRTQEKGKSNNQPKAVSILTVKLSAGVWALLLLMGVWVPGEAVVDRVVAIVNQDIITLSEVERWKAPLLAEIRSEDRLEKREQIQGVLRKILDRLVEERLIDQEVKRYNLKLSAKEMESMLEEIKQKNGMDQETLERALAREGLTFDFFKKQLEKQLLRNRLVGMAVKVESKPGERELKDFYRNNLGRYQGTEAYRPGHILFYVPRDASPEEVQKIQKKCVSVLDRIGKGEDFGEMAILYSEDASAKDRGDLGFFKKGELIPVFEKQALALKVGEVSSVIRTEFGFHIIKLLDRKGGEALPFEEVKDKVQSDYTEQMMEKAYKQFLTTLKERAAIEIKL